MQSFFYVTKNLGHLVLVLFRLLNVRIVSGRLCVRQHLSNLCKMKDHFCLSPHLVDRVGGVDVSRRRFGKYATGRML